MLQYAISLLNLVWLGVSLAAFAWFIWSSRGERRSWRVTTCRALALSLALVSLFPCVSASDDVARLAMLGVQDASDTDDQWTAKHEQSDTSPLATLVRLLDLLESSQTAVSIQIGVVLCLFSFALTLSLKSIDSLLPSYAGRAPPFPPSF